jgi:hypothetical protein
MKKNQNETKTTEGTDRIPCVQKQDTAPVAPKMQIAPSSSYVATCQRLQEQGYTLEELDKDNPHNQWMEEHQLPLGALLTEDTRATLRHNLSTHVQRRLDDAWKHLEKVDDNHAHHALFELHDAIAKLLSMVNHLDQAKTHE